MRVTSLNIEHGCVFTVLMGDYESLNEQPMAAVSGLDFICLTDNPLLRSNTWDVRLVTPMFEMDQVRSQRYVKLRPHEFLPDHDCSLYIDNSVLLSKDPADELRSKLASHDLALFLHSFRESVEAEFAEVALLKFDCRRTLAEQLQHYRNAVPHVLRERPYWSGMLFRRHASPAAIAFSAIWTAHVLRYSRRDQLSLNYALAKSGLQPNAIEEDNHSSTLHSWPHARNRRLEVSIVGNEGET
ncbi:glycosyltransferase domain-containing protein [Aestuariivirga sp.]|jgi:hypothetical protein|uniref:glycosyltransferase domain-containing protein n=1 Tax=Aestuariivirga sp. TaxID=2650926 RepID=UPI0037847FB6